MRSNIMLLEGLKSMIEDLWYKREYVGDYKVPSINIEIEEQGGTIRNAVYYQNLGGLIISGIGGLSHIIESFEGAGIPVPKITVNGKDISPRDRKGIIQSVKDGKFISIKNV